MKYRILFFFMLIFHSVAIAQRRLPIVAFHGVQSGTTEDFIIFKNAGFNISLSVYTRTEDIIRDLKAAEEAGVKLFVYSDSLMLNPEKIINRIKDYPAFYGTYIADEPSSDQFPMLRWRIEGIRKYDKKGKFYVNLFPNNASDTQLRSASYDDYLHRFAEGVHTDFISFDYYPIKNEQVDVAWYDNLEKIRNVAIKFNKPFWAFANSTIFGVHSQPTLAGLKLQQFGNLLYGAKGLQYFTYWTLDEEFRRKNNFQYAVVDENGHPTPIYNLVKEVNQQIRNLESIFVEGTVTDIYHDGHQIPPGTRSLNFLPDNFKIFNKTKESILISFIRKGRKKYTIIQNKDIRNSISFKYKVLPGTDMVDSKNGKTYVLPTKQSSSRVLPGDILIFSYSN